VDATCLAASGESPRGDVRGRRVSDPKATIDGLPSSVRPRLKHLISRAEVFTDRRRARAYLRLPLAAG
jgi:hypothetical protein